MLVESVWYRQLLAPALKECWRVRNFGPVATICRDLTPVALQFVSSDTCQAPVTLQVADGVRFRPELWRMLVGELLLFGAAELPELETPLESYAAVFRQTLTDSRPTFPAVQQAIRGSRDIWFGTYYRPEHAGWNDENDVKRLAGWLASIDREGWIANDLTAVPNEDRNDELFFLREWFPSLRELYRQAEVKNRVVFCEEMS